MCKNVIILLLLILYCPNDLYGDDLGNDNCVNPGMRIDILLVGYCTRFFMCFMISKCSQLAL